jgi:hypothetical protein
LRSNAAASAPRSWAGIPATRLGQQSLASRAS